MEMQVLSSERETLSKKRVQFIKGNFATSSSVADLFSPKGRYGFVEMYTAVEQPFPMEARRYICMLILPGVK